MKKRNFAVFMLILGSLLILLGIGIFVYKEVTTNKNNKKEVENNITEQHEVFKNKVELFNEVRSKYYSEVNDNLYPESVESEYKNWLTILDDYTNKVDDVENASNYLKEKCVNTFYSNKNISNKCEAFIIAYETVMNYYTKDIISFNENLNAYRTKNNINLEESKIKDYPSKYNYMDINTDGNFIGKD